MSSGRKIVLVSEDGEIFRVDEEVACVSKKLKCMIDNGRGGGVIIVTNVVGKIMSRVLEYCEKHVETPNGEDEDLKAWDSEFVNVDNAVVVLLVLVGNSLEIRSLIGLALEKLDDIEGRMTLEEMAEMYGNALDFVSHEVEKEKNQWQRVSE